jgi:hypothetical protein
VIRGIGFAISVGLLAACGTNGGSAAPGASPTLKPSLAEVQVVAQGLGIVNGHFDATEVGVILKDTNPAFAFSVTYLATLYDSQGAQVGVVLVSQADLLPGETIAVSNPGYANPTAAPVRFAITADQHYLTCAFPVIQAHQLLAPVPTAEGVWTVNPEQPSFNGYLPSGTVTGTLEVQSPRRGLRVQALLYDASGKLSGIATDELTTAAGPTPVSIVVKPSSSGLPNPWGPVARATISAYDDLQTLVSSGALGGCQKLTS